jgi:hypothetical protein
MSEFPRELVRRIDEAAVAAYGQHFMAPERRLVRAVRDAVLDYVREHGLPEVSARPTINAAIDAGLVRVVAVAPKTYGATVPLPLNPDKLKNLSSSLAFHMYDDHAAIGDMQQFIDRVSEAAQQSVSREHQP